MKLKKKHKIGDEVKFLLPSGECKVGIIEEIFNISEDWSFYYQVDYFFRTQLWYKIYIKELEGFLNICEYYVL